MSSIYDFTDVLLKDLGEKQDSLVRELIKADASRHDRMCGRIQALEEARATIKNLSKRWSSGDQPEED